jgi:AcrR family transcriptional regulator
MRQQHTHDAKCHWRSGWPSIVLSAAIASRFVLRYDDIVNIAVERMNERQHGSPAAKILSPRGLTQRAERIRSTLREAPGDAVEQLYAIARAYVHFAQENPWLMREMFSGLTIEREAFPDLHHASKSVFMLYIEVIKRGQEQGSIIDVDPGALAGVLWALLHGVAMLTIEHQMRPYTDGPDGVENVTRFSIQMLYEGLGRK